MKWTIGQPQAGDMIRVRAGSVLHYGVYVSDEEIIQFGRSPALGMTSPQDICVLATNIDDFLQGEFLEVAAFDKKEQKRKSTPTQIIESARARIGERGYDILQNNCEHFAYECVFGVHKSEQAERAKSGVLLDVYYAPLCKKVKLSSLFPLSRRAEIEACGSEKVRLEKYSVWKLLAFALKQSLGLQCKKLHFEKKENGQWTCKDCYFSLSHSGNLVAVALSTAPVGIDVEKVAPHAEGVVQKVLSDSERQTYNRLAEGEKTDFFIEKWTQKESVYKKGTKGTFSPRLIERFLGESRVIELNGNRYFLSVACDEIRNLRVFYNEKIK